VEAKVGFGEEIYVCGDTITLGDFEPSQGIQLFATTRSYPIWESKVVMLARGIMVQYKYAVFCGGKFSRFEQIHYNRFLLTDELVKHKMARPVSTVPSNNDSDDEEDEAATTCSDVLDVSPFLPPPTPPVKPVPTYMSSNQVCVFVVSCLLYFVCGLEVREREVERGLTPSTLRNNKKHLSLFPFLFKYIHI
jgi:hypothetical protein